MFHQQPHPKQWTPLERCCKTGYETDSAGGQRGLKSRTDKRGLITAYLYDSYGNITNTCVTRRSAGLRDEMPPAVNFRHPARTISAANHRPEWGTVSATFTAAILFPASVCRQVCGQHRQSIPTGQNASTLRMMLSCWIPSQATNRAFGVLSRENRAFGSTGPLPTNGSRDGRSFITNTVAVHRHERPKSSNQFLYNDREELVQLHRWRRPSSTLRLRRHGPIASLANCETGQKRARWIGLIVHTMTRRTDLE